MLSLKIPPPPGKLALHQKGTSKCKITKASSIPEALLINKVKIRNGFSLMNLGGLLISMTNIRNRLLVKLKVFRIYGLAVICFKILFTLHEEIIRL